MKELHEKGVRKSKHVSLKISRGVLIISIIVFILIAINLVFALIKVPYKGYEYYTAPQTEQECNNINMIYKAEPIVLNDVCLQQECASYNQVCADTNWYGGCVRYNSVCASYKCVKYQKNCGLKMVNKEREGATYSLELDKYNQDTQQTSVIETKNFYVNALDEGSVYWDFVYLPTEAVSCWFRTLSSPQMQDCKDVVRDVQRTREITKYCSLWKKITGICKDEILHVTAG